MSFSCSQDSRFESYLYRYVHTHISMMGFPVRTKGTGNTEHMFSQWGLVGTGNREQGTSQSRAKRDATQSRWRVNFAASTAKKKFDNR